MNSNSLKEIIIRFLTTKDNLLIGLSLSLLICNTQTFASGSNVQPIAQPVNSNPVSMEQPQSRNPAPAVSQQDKKITGSVQDNTGQPIIGANIIEKGTTNGTITDTNGNFSLNTSTHSVLLVSYIGYITQEIPVDGKQHLSVQL